MRIYVTDVAGSVDVTMAGAKRDVKRDTTVELPSHIVTGRNGALGIRQSRTQVSIGADSEVEIPEAAQDGQLVARLVQHRGNVHYDVETRPVRKLRVETPFLVAVVKGTQFTVVVQDETTTISLFEGLLEVRTPDGADVVELNAGEIAIRSIADATIRVLRMDDDDTVPAPQADAGIAGVDGLANAGAADALLGGTAELGNRSLSVGLGDDVNVALGTDVASGASADLSVDLDVDLGLDKDLTAGAGSVDLGADAGIDLGGASADLGLDAGVDLGGTDTSIDLGADAGIDLGGASADLGLDAGADLGGTDTSIDLGAELGDTEIDLGVDLSLDDGIDLGADLSGGDSDGDGGGLLGGLL